MISNTRIFQVLALTLALGALCLSPVLGANPPAPGGGTPKPIGKFKDWTAYSMQDQQNRAICFIVSEPKSSTLSEKGAGRGDPFFLVTRWSAGQALQPSLIMGYPAAADKKIKVKIGSDNFEMFVQGDGAWMDTEDGDKKLTDAMRKGATVTIEGQSAKGTKSTDRYSLAGISAALDKIAACK